MSETVEVILLPSGKSLSVGAGPLANNLTSSGINFNQECGGLGICGKCKVRFIKYAPEPMGGDFALFTKQQIQDGYRLGCSFVASGGEIIEINNGIETHDLKFDKYIKASDLNPWSDDEFTLAIDFGSTNIVGHVMNCKTGSLVASFSQPNSQAVYGADVMTRLAYASHGLLKARKQLNKAALADLSSLVKNLDHTQIKISDVVAVMNSAMEVLMLGHDPDDLGKYPYKPQIDGPVNVKLMNGEGAIGEASFHIPSIIGGYVGSDTVAALVAIEARSPQTPYAVLDLGTNAELAIVTSHGITACSTAAGPAFEGSGINCGMRGVSGAIEKVFISDSRISCKVIGDEMALGITGSGVFSAIGELLRAGALDSFGMFNEKALPKHSILESDGDRRLMLENGIFLSEGDIQQFLLAKAATRAGLDTIMEVCKIAPDELQNIYVCGVFANMIDTKDIVSVGLSPVEENKIIMAGNAAGTGAAKMACSKSVFNHACDLAEGAEHLRLSGHESFNQRFTSGVSF